MIGGLTFLSLHVVGSIGQVAQATAPAATSASVAEVREEELLLYAVELDNSTLTEGMTAYGDQADPLLPMGELARLLDLNIDVSPADGRVTGRLGQAERALTIDLGLGVARLEGREIALSARDVAISPGDIFLRASALERLLPLEIDVRPAELAIRLKATEQLPIQARMERAERMQGLSRSVGANDPVFAVPSPYRFFSPPALDVALETGGESGNDRIPRRYDLRIAGDLLHAGYKGYVGSDEAGDPTTARLEFQRRSREGGLLGPLDATYVSGGDTFTPGLPLGPRNSGGRGFSFSTARLEQANVFQRVTLRGELPLGYDVELYINDVLRSGQRSPVEGRYEFIDVPLVRGLNVIRIVTYGPRGERAEQTRVINVGGGQLATGETSFDFGIVQQEKPLFELGDPDFSRVGFGELRAVASVAHGLSEELTLVGAAAIYPGSRGERRELVSAGARGSLFGMAVQGDVAADMQGGRAAAIGLAGQPLGVSLVARHSEYSGGFVDENTRFFDVVRPLSRHSEMTVDFALPPIGGKIIPLSFRLERDGFRDGGVSWNTLARASTTLADTLLSLGLDYQRDTRPGTPLQHRLTGNIAASRFIDFKWQVRGVLDYELLPEARLRALALTADRNLSEELGIRLGLGKSFGEGADLSAQGGAFFRFPFADLALTGDYMTASNDWRIGLRLAFGLAFDPGRSGYRMTRPGPAGGGSAAFHAFLDSDADGAYDEGEMPVAGVALEGGERKVVTGPDGRAFVTGLGDSVTSRLRADIDKIDAFFVSAPPQNIDFSPRPGQVLAIEYPLTPVGEVLARIRFNRDGKVIGLAAVRVRLVRDGADPVEATTEFDGTALFTDVRPGTYRLEIDPEQAKRLNMRFREPVTVTVEPDGVSSDPQAWVVFGGDGG